MWPALSSVQHVNMKNYYIIVRPKLMCWVNRISHNKSFDKWFHFRWKFNLCGFFCGCFMIQQQNCNHTIRTVSYVSRPEWLIAAQLFENNIYKQMSTTTSTSRHWIDTLHSFDDNNINRIYVTAEQAVPTNVHTEISLSEPNITQENRRHSNRSRWN